MQKNKVTILCTMNLPQSLIDKAADDNVFIDAISFIKVNPVTDDKMTEQIVQLSKQSLTVVFTSMHAAEIVIEKLKSQQHKPFWKIYCMSGTTKKMISAYFGNDVIMDEADNALSLSAKIIRDNIKHVVFFCGNQRRDELPKELAANNISVKELVVYETMLTPQAVPEKYNGILFFSPSAATSFFLANNPGKEITLFAIGNTTADTIKKCSQNKIIVNESPGKETLIENCIEYYQTHPVH